MGDGSVTNEWEQAPKQEDPKPPSSGGSSLRVAWLPETHENSNYILLRIPIEIHLFERGLQAIYLGSRRLPEILGLSEMAFEHLQRAGLVRVPPSTPRLKERVKYPALAAPRR